MGNVLRHFQYARTQHLFFRELRRLLPGGVGAAKPQPPEHQYRRQTGCDARLGRPN